MTRRTKLWICAGLLLVGAGAVVVWRPKVKPQVEVRFVGYSSNGAPVLSFTNKGQQPVCFPSVEVSLYSDMDLGRASFRASPADFIPVLLPGRGTQLVFRNVGIDSGPGLSPPIVQGTAYVNFAAQPSSALHGIKEFLSAVGVLHRFSTPTTGYLVTVTLPPSEKVASPSNTPPASLPR